MSEPILSKITLPRLPHHLVVRQDVINKLATSPTPKLTLISAAAGFGKSTTVADWLHGVEGWVAWVSLDEDDDDLSQFLILLISALQQVEHQVGQRLLNLLQHHDEDTLPPLPTLLGSFLNDLHALPAAGYVVLDDYHFIQQEPIHAALDYLLQHLPPALRVVIVSRQAPPLSLSRLRMQHQLQEIEQSDLLLTRLEVEELLAAAQIQISAEEIEGLMQHTEGWIAGVQLFILSLRHKSFAESIPQSYRHIHDYLFDEIFKHQSDAVQRFLLQTAMLDTFCAALCQFITQDDAAQEVLNYLEQVNLFVIPLDEQWYRYHALFADFLRSRQPPSQDAHLRAAEWYAQNGGYEEALHHALAGGQSQLAEQIVTTYAYEVLYDDQVHRVERWLTRLPPRSLQENVQLQIIQGWIYARGLRLNPLKKIIEEIRPQLAAETDTLRAGEFAALLSVYSQWHDHFGVQLQLALQAQALVPETNRFIHSQLIQVLAMACLMDERSADYEQLLAMMHHTDNRRGLLEAKLASLLTYSFTGQIEPVEQLLPETLALATELNAYQSQMVLCQIRGNMLYYTNQLQESRAIFQQGVDLARDLHLSNYAVVMMYQLAWVCHLLGDDADALMTEAEAITQKLPIPGVAQMFAAAQARLWLARGKARQALEWAESHPFDDQTIPPIFRLFIIGQVLSCWLAHPTEFRINKGLLIVEHLIETALARGLLGLVVYPLVLKAMLQAAQNRPSQADASLRQALQLGLPQRNIRGVIDAGLGIEPLLHRQIEAENSHEMTLYIYALLSALKTPTGVPPTLAEPLSEREQSILRLMAAGLSNQMIAEELVIAVGTVKKHTNAIYTKLDVENRTQAVLRAQELNLI